MAKSRASALRTLAPAGAALAIAWVLGGPGACSQAPGPQLVQVSDVSPHEVEPGDTVAIAGEGFPAGKVARVTFRGTLSRPGERPVRGAEIAMSGTVVGPERILVPFGEVTEALFCGAGDMARHTTFAGDVEVAFTAARRGEPPVGGNLSGVTFDVRPSMRSADVARDADGARFLDWAGVHAVPSVDTRAAAGLVIDAVTPGSRAEAAGLAPGDVVTSFDGVRVASPGDVLPAANDREATLTVRRPASAEETPCTLDVAGYRRAPIEQLVVPLLVMLGALAAVLAFAAPTPALLAGLLDGAVVRLRSRLAASTAGGARSRRPVAPFAASMVAALPPSGTPALADAAAGALLAVMPFGQYLVASQLDVAVLFLGATTAMVTVALVAGRSPFAGAKAALHVVWQHIPPALAVLCVVASTGSLRVQEIARAQGGLPWEWAALRSPPLAAALVLLLTAALVEPTDDVPAGLAALVDEPLDPSRRPRGHWLEAACRAHRVLLAGLAAVLLLGAWRLPGIAPAVQDTRPALELAGATLLLAKTWTLVILLAWARTLGSRPSLAARSRATTRVALPCAVATLGATLAWAWWKPAPAVEVLASGALGVLVAGVLAALALRVRHALGASGAEGAGHVSVFL
jgi:NADH-quinone oxidoreductase subunit H